MISFLFTVLLLKLTSEWWYLFLFLCVTALTPELKSTLDKVVTGNKVVLFMKGTKDFPQCGFSHTVVQILKSLNAPFETVNILENEMLRQGLKEYSSWPTFPQLYIEGEFFGGCDITVGKLMDFLNLLNFSSTIWLVVIFMLFVLLSSSCLWSVVAKGIRLSDILIFPNLACWSFKPCIFC